MGETHEGGCLCGAVRYRVDGAPIIVHCCHCSFCRRLGGSAFSVNAMIEADRIALISGRPEPVHTPSALPAGQIVHRCPSCRVALWSLHSEFGEAVCFLAAGTLDHPERMAPDLHVFTGSKLPWVVIPDGVPAFGELYDAAAVWSPAQLARLAAVMAPG